MSSKCTVCYDEKTVTDNSTGEVICGNCGTVLAENIEVSNERRAFSKEEFESRAQTGAPTSLTRHDMGLSTIISRVNKDASGRKIDAKMRPMIDRLRTWDFRTQASSHTDRNLIFALSELNKLKYKLSLTDAVIEKAAYIYRKAQKRKLVRGRTMIALVSASLYAACRELDTRRTLKDIAASSNIRVKDLARSYRLLLREFDLDIQLPDPTKSVATIASKLGFNERTIRDAARILDEVREHGGSAGKDPMGLAAATLYLICVNHNEKISQKELAEAADVTEVTIRNRAKELKKKYAKLFSL